MSGAPSSLGRDASAALNVAIVSLPLALGVGLIAFASLGPEYASLGAVSGLYATIFITLVPPFVGSSKYQFNVPGPAAAGIASALGAMILADPAIRDGAAGLGGAAELAVGAMFLAVLIAGLLQVAMGVLGLGGLIKLVPKPVISGVLNGVVVLILWAQVPNALGLAAGTRAMDALTGAAPINGAATAVCGAAVASVLAARRWFPKLPYLLVGLVVGAAAHAGLARVLGAEAMGPTIGAVPVALPTPSQLTRIAAVAGDPRLGAVLPELLVAAATMAVIGAIGMLVTAASADTLSNTRHSPRGELIGLGVGNACSAIFGGVACGGSPGGVLANAESGGSSRRVHVICAALLTLLVAGLGPALDYVPLAAVAGSLFVMALGFFDPWTSDLARKLARTREPALRRNLGLSLALIGTVMGLVVFVDMVTGLVVGLGLELARFILGSGPVLVRQVISDGIHSNVVRRPESMARLREHRDTIVVVVLQGSLFFGNTDHLGRRIDALPARVRWVVLDFRRVTDVDASGALMLRQIDRRLAADGRVLLLAYLPESAELREVLSQMALSEVSSDGRFFDDTNAALAAAEDALLAEHGGGDGGEMSPRDFIAFDGFTDEDIATLGLERRDFEPGELVMREGEPADGMFIIRRGYVSVIKSSEGERGVVLVRFGPGVSVGEMSLFSGEARTADVRATEPAELYHLSRERFEALRASHPGLAARLTTNLAGSLARRLASASETIRALEAS